MGVIFLAGPSAAQVIIGGEADGQPAVIVDQGVLDALGPPRGFAPPAPPSAIRTPTMPGPPPPASAPSHPVDLRPAPARTAMSVAEPPSWRPPLPGRRPAPEVAAVVATDPLADETVDVGPPDTATDAPAEAPVESPEPATEMEPREPDQASAELDEPGADAPSPGMRPLTVLTQPLGVGASVSPARSDAENEAQAPPDTDRPDEAAVPPAEPPIAEAPPATPSIETQQPADQVAEAPMADTAAAAPPDTDLTLSIPFDIGADSLDDEALDLLSGVADRMTASAEPRLSIVAYATGDAGTARNARSLSLTRALAVREYLMMQGVRLTRIDMRALGDTAEDEPRDRIDLELNY